MKICFFANLKGHNNWREMFEKIEFYRVDIQILKDLGHEVILAPRIMDVDWDADFFYCWWWGYSAIPLLCSQLLRKPCIVTGAFDYATCRQELPGICYLDRPVWQKKIINYVLGRASASLFVSRFEFEEVTENLHVKRAELVPHAVNTDIYKPSEVEDERSNYFFSISWTSKTNVIRKGIVQVIQAFAKVASEHSELQLLIAGKPGNYEAALRDMVAELGLAGRVKFLGMISEQEKLVHLRHCLAYVQPTLYEGFGLAIAEAVASGCLVITSHRGAVPEVVGEFGRCVDPHDVSAIANEMRDVIDNPPTQEYKIAAHNRIKQMYSLDIRRKHLSRIIDEIAK